MIDFVDPVLRASPESKRPKKLYSFQNFALIIFVILGIAGLIWLIYVGNASTLNTKPQKTIDVSDRIENVEFDGRIDSIQTNPEN